MLQQIFQTLRITVSSNFANPISNNVVKKLTKGSYNTFGAFIQSLSSEEEYFLTEFLFIRLNAIESIGQTETFHWHHLFLAWDSVSGGSNYHTALVMNDESDKPTKVIYAEAIGFLCDELRYGKKLGKNKMIDYLTIECMNANWTNIST